MNPTTPPLTPAADLDKIDAVLQAAVACASAPSMRQFVETAISLLSLARSAVPVGAIAASRRAPSLPHVAMPEQLTPLDYRAQGREEALAIILAESAEDPFAECIAYDSEGDCYWDEDKLRALMHIGDKKHDAYDRAEAAHWDALGHKEEAEREMLLVQKAPFYKPLTDFLAKHEAWDLMGDLKRAAQPAEGGAAPTEQCDCCKDIRAAEAIYGDGPVEGSAQVAMTADDALIMWQDAGLNALRKAAPRLSVTTAEKALEFARLLSERIAAPERSDTPAGWKLVPSNPDQRMINAFIAEYERPGGTESGCYHAMLAAAPAPLVTDVDTGKGFALHFSREDWGVIFDGVMLEIARSEARKQANAASNSDERVEQGKAILTAIREASSTTPTAASKALDAAAPAEIPLNEDTIDILGRPNFTCISIAHRLRQMGHEIPKRSENEQAATIHFLLNMYLQHGADWREKANGHLRATKADGDKQGAQGDA